MAQFFVDSHAHLDDAAFDADREAAIERARAAGLRYILAISGGSGPDDLASALPIAERYDWIYATVGIHPHEATKAEERHFERLLAASRNPKVIGVGEIGLDYYYDHSPREEQKHVLIRQLAIAGELKLPIIIHCRDAWEDLTSIIEVHWKSTGLGGILHCFSGSRETAVEFLEWGFLISFAGNITFKKADRLRAIAQDIPLESILAETDCPYLAPVPHRGRRNEPAYVREVTRALATLRSVSEEEMGRWVVENFQRLFRLP
ncbi:MAG: TatD family hydrolase [Acidobacteriia bacterium]|nr:TatD family hydrolase [Terriglobia bacterium]